MEFHALANIFPLMEGPAFDEMVSDIAENGLRESVVLFEGKILDGRNRFRACEESGEEPHFVDFTGDDALAHVISLNLHRRHLSESQRAMVAANIASFSHGGARDQEANLPLADTKPPVTNTDAAQMLNVSERTVKSARKVKDEGDDSLVKKVEGGSVSVSAAADVASLPKDEQADIVAKGEKEILAAAKKIRADRAVKNREVRLEKIAEISKGNEDLDTSQKYAVVYADPPWRYENPPMGGGNRSIENHYPTMTLEEICEMPVSEIVTDDAILYLWATAPKLRECMDVIEAWGFEYRTNLCWDKVNIGMGYHARNQHELLLVATRGKIPPPQAGTQPSSVLSQKRTGHSAKPSFYAEMIEGSYPQLPKIELFCRSPRDGWSVWGNQSEGAAA